jgi:hypothetical protein
MSTPILFTDAQIDAMAVLAKAALPAAINGRLEKAVRLVRSSSVELHEDGSAVVISETDGLTGYLVQHGKCTCEDFRFQPAEVQGWCAHAIARALVLRLQRHTITPPNGTQEPHVDATEAERREHASIETPETDRGNLGLPDASESIPELLRPHVVTIQGKAFVKVGGLLALAHARGLQSLTTIFTYNDAELSLAQSTAVFPFGSFTDVGDASPTNCNAKVRLHFRRVAATRSTARALRQALNVSMVALEELSGEVVDG